MSNQTAVYNTPLFKMKGDGTYFFASHAIC